MNKIISLLGDKSTFIGLSLLLIIGTVSCYSDYGLTESDFDIVGTYYDENFNFSSAKTYAIPETIFHVTDDDPVSQYDANILNSIISNMNNRGYERIEDVSASNIPDVIVFVAVTSSEYAGAVVYPPSYGWYPGWGYPGYGWYYPPYYGGTVSTYSYTTGSIIIQMGDAKNPNMSEETINTVWLGGINGILESSGASINVRIRESIDQAFEQSPYLVSE